MVDRVVRVILDPSGVRRGARTVENELNRVDRTQRRVSRGTNLLRNTLITLFSAATIRTISRTADAYALVQNRLRLVTDGTAQLRAVSDELFASSQRTRTSFESTAELFARVARSTEQLGLSQQEVLTFTETVSQAIQVSGATAAEASAGVVQFSQGLASGALRGDELRSVLEQLPRLAQALASGLGVGIGELRELGEAGELTTTRIIGALQAVAPEIAREFMQLNPTIGQTFTLLQNSALQVVGRLDEMLGISQRVTRALTDLSMDIDSGSGALETFARRLAFILDIGGIITRTLVGLAQGFGFVGRAIGGILAGNFEAVAEDARQLRDQIQLIGTDAIDVFAGNGSFTVGLEENLQRMRDLRMEADGVDLTEVTGGGTTDNGPTQDEIDAQNAFLAGLEQTRMELELETTAGESAANAIALYRIETEAATLGDRAFQEAALRAGLAINQQREALERLERQREDSSVIEEIQQEIELIQLSERARAQETAVRMLSTEATNEQREAVRALAGELFDLEEAARRQTDVLRDLAESAAQNVQSAFADFLFDPFEDGLDGLLVSFLDTTRRIAAEALANQILQGILGAAGGTAGGGGFASLLLGGLSGRQSGGSVLAGQPVVVGETQPEIFVPSTNGRVEPNLAGMTAAPEVNLTVVNQTSEDDIVGAMRGTAGEELILNTIRANPEALRQVTG